MSPANENERPKAPGACPVCGKPVQEAVKPFCSTRCANVDLQRWLTGRYAIPVVEEDRGIDDGSAESGAER